MGLYGEIKIGGALFGAPPGFSVTLSSLARLRHKKSSIAETFGKPGLKTPKPF
jgi:hypothetical protein